LLPNSWSEIPAEQTTFRRTERILFPTFELLCETFGKSVGTEDCAKLLRNPNGFKKLVIYFCINRVQLFSGKDNRTGRKKNFVISYMGWLCF
jgi:hypothetical protein